MSLQLLVLEFLTGELVVQVLYRTQDGPGSEKKVLRWRRLMCTTFFRIPRLCNRTLT